MPFAATWMDLEIIILSDQDAEKTKITWYNLYAESKKIIQMNLFTKEKQMSKTNLWLSNGKGGERHKLGVWD